MEYRRPFGTRGMRTTENERPERDIELVLLLLTVSAVSLVFSGFDWGDRTPFWVPLPFVILAAQLLAAVVLGKLLGRLRREGTLWSDRGSDPYAGRRRASGAAVGRQRLEREIKFGVATAAMTALVLAFYGFDWDDRILMGIPVPGVVLVLHATTAVVLVRLLRQQKLDAATESDPSLRPLA